MNPVWTPLKTELAIWHAEGLELPIWWRDDDAVKPSAQLDQLIALSESIGVPVHLAVIPTGATKALADRLADASGIVPVVHGFAHRNHAPLAGKKAEFGNHRAMAQIRADIRDGISRLRTVFGSKLAPMFVPPWNRIAAGVVGGLQETGYRALSTFAPRQSRFATGDLEQINTHIDPVDWQGSRSLIAPDSLIEHTVILLQKRRAGVHDNAEPLGLLTHHLIHDPAIWAFTEGFIETLLTGPVQLWTLHLLTEDTP